MNLSVALPLGSGVRAARRRDLGVAIEHDRAATVLDQRAARVETRRDLRVVLGIDAGLDLVLAEKLQTMDPAQARRAALLDVARERAGSADRVRRVHRAVRDERVRIVGADIRAPGARGRGFAAKAADAREAAALQDLQWHRVESRIERARVERAAMPRDRRFDLVGAVVELRRPACGRIGRETPALRRGRRMTVQRRASARARLRDQADLSLLLRCRGEIDLADHLRRA
jgi:hypothetical protein